MLHEVPSLSSLVTNDILYTRCQESSGLVLQACLAQGCFGMDVRTERGRLEKQLDIMCVVRKKTGNLVLEGDKKASIPGPPWQLVWLWIRRQDANHTANFIFFFFPLEEAWSIVKVFSEKKRARYKLALAPQSWYFCYQIVGLGLWVVLCLVFPSLLGSFSCVTLQSLFRGTQCAEKASGFARSSAFICWNPKWCWCFLQANY